MQLRQSLHTIKEVLSKPKYFVLTMIIAFLFYFLNIFIFDIATLHSLSSTLGFFGSLKALFSLAFNFSAAVEVHTVWSIIIISALVGVFSSLIIHKIRLNLKIQDGKKTGILGGVAFFLAVFVPGCAACGVGLLALIGLSGAVAGFLGGHSILLSIISIAILLIVILKLSNDMYICKNPKLKVKNLKGGSKK